MAAKLTATKLVTTEGIAFPFSIPMYGEIEGIVALNLFLRHYEELVDAHNRLGKHVEILEDVCKAVCAIPEHSNEESYDELYEFRLIPLIEILKGAMGAMGD